MLEKIGLLMAELITVEGKEIQLWKFNDDRFEDIRFVRSDDLFDLFDSGRKLYNNDIFTKFQFVINENIEYGVWVLENQWGLSHRSDGPILFDEIGMDTVIKIAKNFIYVNAYGYPDNEKVNEYQLKLFNVRGLYGLETT